jgi:hypothetical protein
MKQSRLETIIERIHGLQEELEQAFELLLEEKQKEFFYTLEKGKVIFHRGISELHRKYRTGLLPYLLKARPAHVLSAPVIYIVFLPFLLLDLFVTVYQHFCFRLYSIPRVRRSDYIVIDRQHLAYLNAIEKFNCMYCGYANGVVEYVREIVARTEQYWCPIKHAGHVLSQHARVVHFAEYGDAEHFRKKLEQLRKEFKAKDPG